LENQNVSNISFLPIRQTLPTIPLALLPLIEPFRPHTVRGLSPNTLAKRLFSDVRDPDLLILSIEGFPRPLLNRSLLVAPGVYLRSSLLLIESLPNPSMQSLIDRSVREVSSVDLIAILQPNPV
jgi:hypothetical protein